MTKNGEHEISIITDPLKIELHPPPEKIVLANDLRKCRYALLD